MAGAMGTPGGPALLEKLLSFCEELHLSVPLPSLAHRVQIWVILQCSPPSHFSSPGDHWPLGSFLWD